MSTLDAFTPTDAPAAEPLEIVVTAGLAAAVGSILIFLGVTDFVSYVYGYRPTATALAVLYGRSFLLAVVGWSALCWALLRVGRGIFARP